ncbi:hypothetical protein MLD38_008722 [Melastoma candidum]|uniref:Uncharacterized protein n=1 Tax=Melastoma candidum TaxID=119954 RepID=A0ACB9RVF4_9MYRT|nr:hypothetical protein MLD38_008722 [Melastoma candidum]
MAFSAILRRTVGSAAIRALRTQRACNYSAMAFASLKRSDAVALDQDRALGRAHGSSCCAEESDDHDKVEDVPGGFPFEIEDKSGYQTITLTREYQGEEIKVEVSMPDLVTGEEDEGGNDNDDDEKANQSSIPLVVSIAKGNGPCLEFGCTAYPDEVVIDSLAVKKPDTAEDQIAYEGPDFQDLDENLQKAFHKYLDIRGIKPSTTNFPVRVHDQQGQQGVLELVE